MSAVTNDGVLLRHEAGELVVRAKPSEVPPAQLAALRRHKEALRSILEVFGEARVRIRPRTECPVWTPKPKRRKAGP